MSNTKPPLVWHNLLLIGIGGALGATARYLLTLILPNQSWPWATISANLLACTLMGFLLGLASQKLSHISWLMPLGTTGFCGGFSTLSTHAQELFFLGPKSGLIWAIVHLFLCVAVCAVAYQATRHLTYAKSDLAKAETITEDIYADLGGE